MDLTSRSLEVNNEVSMITEITESFELEGTPKGHLVHLPCTEQEHLQ